LRAAVLLLLLLPAAFSHAADLAGLRVLLDEAQALFHQAANTANEEAARALYLQALDRYLTVVGEGQGRNAKLYYNIGNSYYMIGDIGRSILFYRKAEMLDPADGNLRHNLGYVRSQRLDRLPSGQLSETLRIGLFWHYLLSPQTKLVLFIVFFAGACVTAALAILRARRWKTVLLFISAGLALLFLGSLSEGEIRLHSLHDGVVVAEEVDIRKGDGTAYQRSYLDPLHAGTEFRLLEERAGWYRILLPDGRRGWIPGTAAEMVGLP
jgi:tetratricopeptide (TPR) repeat protein